MVLGGEMLGERREGGEAAWGEKGGYVVKGE